MSKIKKTTPTDYEIHQLLKERWSPRAFSDKAITEQEMHQLLEAGRWAPSSNNLQPWAFVWGLKGSETYDRIFDCLHDFNQGWAGNAPALMLSAFNKKMPSGKDHFHAPYDLGLFMANVSIQAQSMGIAVHQMAGIHFKKAREEFGFPEDFHVATGTAIGYYGGEIESIPEDLQDDEKKTKRERKQQSEFAFNGDYKGKK